MLSGCYNLIASLWPGVHAYTVVLILTLGTNYNVHLNCVLNIILLIANTQNPDQGHINENKLKASVAC